MDQYEAHNTQVRIARAQLEARRSQMDHGDYMAALQTIGNEKSAPTVVDRMASAALSAAVAVFALILLVVFAVWILFLMAIAPGALVTAFVVETLSMHPPMWFMYLFGIGLSAVLFHRIYVLRGRDREKAIHAYVWVCLACTVTVLIPMILGAAWPKNFYGLYNGSRNGVDLMPSGWASSGLSGPWDAAEYQKQLAAQERVSAQNAPQSSPAPAPAVQQPVATETAVVPTPMASAAVQAAQAPTLASSSPTMESTHGTQAVAVSSEQSPATDARPSFDCGKARTFHELHVCANANLAQLDVQLATVYQSAMSAAKVPQVIKLDQGKWRRELDICRDDVCLVRQYEARINQLKRVAAGTADR